MDLSHSTGVFGKLQGASGLNPPNFFKNSPNYSENSPNYSENSADIPGNSPNIPENSADIPGNSPNHVLNPSNFIDFSDRYRDISQEFL